MSSELEKKEQSQSAFPLATLVPPDLVPGRKAEGDLSQGLAKLVLSLIDALRRLMEKQARRRISEGSLTHSEVERLGLAFMRLDEKLSELAAQFKLSRADLRLALLPEGAEAQRGEFFDLVDLLDRIIEKGLVVFGDLGLSVADVELLNLQLRLAVSPTRRRGSSRRPNLVGATKMRRPRGARKIRCGSPWRPRVK